MARRNGYTQNNQLCWTCANAVPDGKHGCAWSRDLLPVKGWTATRSTNNGTETWAVKDCPEFLQDSKDTQRIADKAFRERIEAGRVHGKKSNRRVGRHMEDTYFVENAGE